jgi:hypothetical protein
LQRLWITKQSSFRYFKASLFTIPLAVMLYVHFPLYLVFNFTHSAYHIFLAPISRNPPARSYVCALSFTQHWACCICRD